ncbi:hypothetical protein F5876DRAFT_72907 [Lentinula aff. lateritia]|uniref:Uncharacterized protein n=1 Tax=Lentinula aff. lateritia TaxID=2804960 RepID=A0ACC1UD23_9AGAR|nr:hypothetical protein F5876DRAFT_72907 [Lentinula aff. lateritia]
MAIIFISDALNFFLQPFIDVTMDLEAQCLSLATYAHLAAAMFLRGHLSFLTSALYADSHAIVKNILFTVVKLALNDSSILYYIILDGTDHLVALTEVVVTLLRNPNLDSGHRRLNLSGAIRINHINPKSCLGNYRVGDVNIMKLWAQWKLDHVTVALVLTHRRAALRARSVNNLSKLPFTSSDNSVTNCNLSNKFHHMPIAATQNNQPLSPLTSDSDSGSDYCPQLSCIQIMPNIFSCVLDKTITYAKWKPSGNGMPGTMSCGKITVKTLECAKHDSRIFLMNNCN